MEKDVETFGRFTHCLLTRQATGLYNVLKVQKNNTVIDQDGPQSKESTDLVSPVVGSNDDATNRRKEFTEQNDEPDSKNAKQQLNENHKHTAEPYVQEYTVGQTTGNVTENTAWKILSNVMNFP